MEEIIQSLQTWGYVLLFVYSLYGGYVGLIAAASLSALGKFDITLCQFFAEENEAVTLNDKEKEVLSLWAALSDKNKELILYIMKHM